MIEKIPFGRTGHLSSRAIFGAAALGAMKEAKALATLDMVMEAGVNHIDTAAGYGDSELRLAPWLKSHRKDVFLATKTRFRDGPRAREGLLRSLERMGVDQVDLIQMHNLAQPADWDIAMGDNGALEALVAAKEEGLVKHIGVTGHGTYIAAMHLKSLAAYDFDSVLCPYNYTMNTAGPYADDFEQLYALCQERGVAMQTIKSIAARRWTETDQDPKFSWYRPIRDEDAVRRAVHYVLSRPGLFINTSSDATLLALMLKAAAEPVEAPTAAAMEADVASMGIEPLFVRDQSDDVQISD